MHVCVHVRTGPKHADVGATSDNIAKVYLALDQNDKALVMYKEALAIKKSTLGVPPLQLGERDCT